MSATARGVSAFVFLVTQILNLMLTVHHFVFSQTHPDEMIQWSWLYFLLMAFMFVFMLSHVFFFVLQNTNANEFAKIKRFADSFGACSLFTAFLFGTVQASELANYSDLNTTFPQWELALMMSLNILHIVVKTPEHL